MPAAISLTRRSTREQGQGCWSKITDKDILGMKAQMDLIFEAAIGIADFQSKDYAGAIKT